jgi:protein-L-isoaspartate O-methyltransferase
MVERLEEKQGRLEPAIRRALLQLRLEILMPRAYVRRVPDGVEPGVWQLLDGSVPQDRAKWIATIFSGDSVRIQHDGEHPGAQRRGVVTGGQITSMSSIMAMTADMLTGLNLESGQRVLDLGSGAGVTGALICALCGDVNVTLLDRDRQLSAWVRERLELLGYRPSVITGDGLAGCPQDAPFDRIHSGFSVPCVPGAWTQQLAAGGRLLTSVTTRSPSWPALAVVSRSARGRLEGELRGVWSGHRPVHGMTWLNVKQHRERIASAQGRRGTTALEPPPPDEYGFWLALNYCAPGLVRDSRADHLTLVAPDEDSWVVVRSDGHGGWQTQSHGDRDIWAEAEDVHARWCAAGRPAVYRLELSSDGTQHVTSPDGALHWALAVAGSDVPAEPLGRRR